ncbi:MAG: hypothetical protein ACE37N_10145 [Pseudohongiellaceae bacterium]
MKITRLVVAATAIGLCLNSQAAEVGDSLTIRSFGSVAGVYADTDQAEFFHSIAVTPEGPGRSGSVNYNTGTKFAGQVDWSISDRWSATAQTLVKQYENGEWTPRMEWAFVKYSASNELDIRVGRIRPPVYMLSDFLDVNFAHPWVRPPVEQYYNIPVTNMDGVDLLWRPDFAGYSLLIQPYYGQKDLRTTTPGDTVEIDNFGLNMSASKGDFTYRLGYWNADLVMDIGLFKQAEMGLSQLCAVTGDPVACEQDDLMNMDNINYRFLSAGLTWDRGDYFVQSEFGRAISNSTTVADSVAYYVSGGARLNLWTPFVSYSKFDNRMPQNFTESAIPTVNQITFGVLNNNAQTQGTVTAGIRYDIKPTVSLKAQWDHTRTSDCAGNARTCRGMFGRSTDAFKATEQDVNLISVSVDFIF